MKRPLGVTLIALWQFCKAGFLGLAMAIALWHPGGQRPPSLLLAYLVFIAAPGKEAGLIGLLGIALSIYAIGGGLWQMKNWARYALLLQSGWMLGRFLVFLFIGVWSLGWPWHLNSLQPLAATIVIGIDAMVFWYLCLEEVKQGFEQESMLVGRTRSGPAAVATTRLDEAYACALAEYGNKGFEYWKGLMGQGPIIFPHPNDAKKQVEISPIWDPSSEPGAGGPIRVLVSLLHATAFGAQLPIRSFLVYPDGTVVRSERDRQS